MFVVRQVTKKTCERGPKVHIAFLDFVKAYYFVDREGCWKVLQMYGVGVKLLNVIKSFYVNSKTCSRIRGIKSG